MVEDDVEVQRQLRWAFDEYDIRFATDRKGAVAVFRGDDIPVVTLDLGLPPDPDGASEGLATLEAILSVAPQTKVIVVTGNEDRKNALRAIELGAYDFYQKPIDAAVLGLLIDRAQKLYQLEEENRRSARVPSHSPLEGLISASPEMSRVCRSIERLAPTAARVLLLGESGTGKELLARAVHNLSARAAQPFVAINCAAIPENLLESELFGHERGAFTGAVKQTIGRIETANRGTLFLDEIGDLPMPLQAKLLRFLQEHRIERIGGRTEIAVDVRVVSATHQDLTGLIRDGRFREDLYYRLSEVTVKIPPLRERQGDAVVVARRLLEQYKKENGRTLRGLAPDAVRALEAHTWPGNIRELQNRMKRAVIMAEGPILTAEDLDLVPPASEPSMSLKDARAEAERQALARALSRVDGNISQAARLLGVSRPTLYDLMRQHGIET
jgi:two-component system NtrC family response regulator